MADGFSELIALVRVNSDGAVLRRALRNLDADDGLVAKMAAEPHLRAVMAEFVGRLVRAFGSLEAIRGQTILDIACGSRSSRSPETDRQTAAFEPWMCRLLAELGAHAVGVDIGDLHGERFEHHRVDLGVPGALDFLPDGSFDAIHESRLFGSPEFRSAYAGATDRVRAEIHRQERRLLRPGGILIHSDGRGSLGASARSPPDRPAGAGTHRNRGAGRRVFVNRPARPRPVTRMEDRVRPSRIIAAVIVALVGLLWIGQGSGLVGGSAMTGSSFWGAVGILLVVVAVVIVARERYLMARR